jgi:hypothetical protein
MESAEPDGSEVDEAAFDEWAVRARRMAAFSPRGKVASVIDSGERVVTGVRLKCPDQVLEPVFSAIDVPADGNCLFHAAWQAARVAGILRPFGLRGIDHVFSLRVQVARILFQYTLAVS